MKSLISNITLLTLCGGLSLAVTPGPEETAISIADFGTNKIMSGPAVSLNDQYKGVVKIEADSEVPNYISPWEIGGFRGGTGTGFLIDGKMFMTNAHVVSNAKRLYVSMYGDSRKIPAKVKYVAHDADLALLEVEDFKPFEKLKPFTFSESLPELEDEVRVIGYPIGGNRLSVTRGVVSRIEFTYYAHPRTEEHLTIQVDAAINPGNSGGPALMGSKVIGVAFQGLENANNTGYVIPTPVIQRFLADVKDGKYDSYVNLGADLFPIMNPAMRKSLGLPDDERGVMVGTVVKGGSSDGILKEGDVVLKINNYDVDSSGMINLDNQNLNMSELIERCFNNDKLNMLIIRDGKKENVVVTMKPSRTKDIMMAQYDQLPRYMVYGGLVFQPMQRNVLGANKISFTEIANDLKDFEEKGECVTNDDLVMVTKVLDDEINSGFSNEIGQPILESINGVPVKGLKHAYELLHKDEPKDFIVIKFRNNDRPIVIDGKKVKEANKRIAKTYNIKQSSRLEKMPISNS